MREYKSFGTECKALRPLYANRADSLRNFSSGGVTQDGVGIGGRRGAYHREQRHKCDGLYEGHGSFAGNDR